MTHLIAGGRAIPYAIRESIRARSPSLSISPATGLVLVVPRPRQSQQQIARFLQQSQHWILRQVDRLAEASSRMPRRWPYGSTLLYRGEEHAVRLQEGLPAVVRSAEGALEVRMPQPGIERARRLLKRWYMDEASRWLVARTETLGSTLGIAWERVRVRDLQRRWGSCSLRGHLSFNYRLVMAPPEVMDYVVVHELMHRRELNHSPRFWSLIAEACPIYREAIAWLRDYSAYLDFLV